MKRHPLLLIPFVFATLSFIAHAGTPPPSVSDESGPLRPVGSVSASGASNLDDLEAKLAEKAREQGALAWRINAANGSNKMSGTAIIYK